MYSDYSGGPRSGRDQIASLMGPRGGTVGDGLRLAVINGIGLVVALVTIGLISLLMRVLDLPHVLVSFALGVVFVAIAIYFWFRYAAAHGRAARARQRTASPDVFGTVAAAPFALLSLMLVGLGLFDLLGAMFTVSLSRAVDGLQRFLFAIIVLGLAVANVIIARAASD